MKKVLKKFNRTLSIMLAAAMVLTTVPTTALTVHAETGDEIAADAANQSNPDNSQGDPGNKQNDGNNNAATQGNGTDGSNGSDGANGDGATNGTDGGTGNGATNGTGGSTGNDSTNGTGSDANNGASNGIGGNSDNSTGANNGIVTGGDTSDEGLQTTGEDTDEITDTADAKSAPVVAGDGTVKINALRQTGGDLTTGTTSDYSVTWYGGCVSGDKLVAGYDLDFVIEPANGRELKSVTYKIGSDGSDTAASYTDAGGVHTDAHATISKDNIVETTGEGENVKTTVKDVTITVTTSDASHQVSFAAASGGVDDYTLYTVANNQTLEALSMTSGAATDSTAVAFNTSKKYAIVLRTPASQVLESIKLGGQDITFTRNDTLKIGADVTPCYTFDVQPSAAKYNLPTNKENQAAAVTISVRAMRTVTLALSADAADKLVIDTAAAGACAIVAPANTADESNVLKYNVSKGSDDATDAEKEKYFNINTSNPLNVFAEGTANLNKTLKFKIKPRTTANHSVTEVKAKTSESPAREIPVTMGTPGEDGSVECSIDLKAIGTLSGNITLTLSAKSALDPKKDTVHTIEFKGKDGDALNRVDLKGLESADGTGTAVALASGVTSATTDKGHYVIQVAPKTGYELVKGTATDKDGANAALTDKQYVTVKETRKIETVAGSNEWAATTVTYEHKEAIGDFDSSDPPAFVVADFDLPLTGTYPGGDNAGKDWTVVKAEITIDARPAANDDAKLVLFKVVDDKATYAIPATAGVSKVSDEDWTANENTTYPKADGGDLYDVAKSVDMLTFTVTSDVEPVVQTKVGSTPTTTTIPVSSVSGNVYTYKVATKNFSATSTDKNIVEINKKTENQNFTIVSENNDLVAATGIKHAIGTADLANTIAGLADGGAVGNGDTRHTWTDNDLFKLGDTVKLVFTAKPGVSFESVTWTMGEGANAKNGSATIVAAEDENGWATATIEGLVITGALKVDVKTASSYYVVLTGGVNAGGKNGVYTADYNAAAITVALKQRNADAGDAKFQNIVILDGDKTASTKATYAKSGVTATIDSIHPDEWGKTLTIEVYRSKTEKYTATLKVSAASNSVTVEELESGEEIGESDTVETRVDSVLQFKVIPGEGANLKDLKATIRSAKDNADSSEDQAAQSLATIDTTGSYGADGINDSNGYVKVTVPARKTAGGKIALVISNKNADAKGNLSDAALKGGKIVIDLQAPLVASDEVSLAADPGRSTNTGVSLNLGLNTGRYMPVAPATGDLYYKVDVSDIKAASTSYKGTLTLKSAATKYYKIDKTTDNFYDAGEAAEYIKEELVDSYVKESGGAGDVPVIVSAKVTVTLVQSLSSTNFVTTAPSSDADYAAGTPWSETLSTNVPIYETKLSVKRLNSLTVYTGNEAGTVIAEPVFSAGTSYDSLSLKFVNTKTGNVYASSAPAVGVETVTYGNYKAWVNSDNTISMSVDKAVTANSKGTKDFVKDLGLKVIAASAAGDYAATTVIKPKVVQGIVDVSFDESKGTLPTELYRDPKNGAVKTVKASAMLNLGSKDNKPAKSTLTWAITGSDGAQANLTDHMKEAIRAGEITVKNGSISVKKTYQLSSTAADNKFWVTVKAADFDGYYGNRTVWDGTRSRMATHEFTITDKNQTISSLILLDADGKVVSPSGLTAKNFRDGLYIAAVKGGAAAKSEYVDANDFIPVTFKSSKKTVAVSTFGNFNGGAAAWLEKCAKLTYNGSGEVKISAATVDGGKGAGAKAEIALNVTGDAGLGLMLKDVTGGEYYDKTVEYSGGSNELYELYLQNNTSGTWVSENQYKNVSVSLKGGKLIQNKAFKTTRQNLLGTVIVTNAKDGVATITLKDTVNKTTETYQIVNTGVSSVSAPKVKLVDPKKIDRKTENITYKLDARNVSYAGMYVKVTPDLSIDETKNKAYDLMQYNDIYEDVAGNNNASAGVFRRVNEDSEFTLSTGGGLASGKYNMFVTVGNVENGKFVPAAKDAKVSFNVSGKFNSSLTVGNSYKLDAKGLATTKLSVKTDATWTVSDVSDIIDDQKKQGVDQHSNRFTEFFEIKRYGLSGGPGSALEVKAANYSINTANGEYATIGLKDNLTATQIAEITDKANRADCTGWITVSNGYYTKDVKVSIQFTNKKLTAVAEPVYASQTGVPVTFSVLDGNVKQKVVMASVVSGSIVDGTITADGSETLSFTTKPNLAANKGYEIVMNVVTQGSLTAAKNKDGAALTSAEILKDYGKEVTLKLEVKPLDSKKILNVKNNKIVLNSQAYNATKGNNGYVLADTGYGRYQVDVPYTFTTQNAQISSKEGSVKVTLKDNEMTVGGEKINLVDAVPVSGVDIYDMNGVKVIDSANVLRVSLNKKALVNHKTAKFGRSLSVSIDVKVANSNNEDGVVETLKLNLVIPKQPASFTEVQKAVNDAHLENVKPGNMFKEAEIVSSLRTNITNKLAKLVPADTDVAYSAVTLTGKDGGTTDALLVAQGTGKITFTLTDKVTGTAQSMTASSYDLGMMDSITGGSIYQVDTIKAAIDTPKVNTSSYTFPWSNSTTKEDVIKEIKKLDGIKGVITDANGKDNPRKSNISLNVTYFEKKNATSKAAGYLAARIKISDLLTGRYAYAYINLNDGTTTVTNRTNIAKLQGISDAYSDVKTALADSEIGDIIDECGGNESRVKAEILRVAKEAAANNDIEMSITKWTWTAATAGTTDGSLAFTLKMIEDGREREITSTVAIDRTKAVKYVPLTAAGGGASATKVASDYVLDTANNNAAKAVIVTAAKDDGNGSEFDVDGTDADNIEALTANLNLKLAELDASDDTVTPDSTAIYGYNFTVDDLKFTAATSTKAARISFKVKITSKVGGATNSIQVAETLLGVDGTDVNAKNMTKAELKAVMDALGTDGNDGATGKELTVAAGTDMADATAVATAIANLLKTGGTKQLVAAAQTGELADADEATCVTVTVPAVAADVSSVYTLESVKIQVKTTGGALVYEVTKTLKVKVSG